MKLFQPGFKPLINKIVGSRFNRDVPFTTASLFMQPILNEQVLN